MTTPMTTAISEPMLDASDGRIRLADGRTLAYRTYGPDDAPPVFYFHGWPGSRLEPGFFDLRTVRLIATDRPGYGRSDAHETRRLADWPLDIEALADALGLERFGIVGLSGGGPYAMACAHALRDRVSVCVLISALGPPEAEGMSSRRLSLLRGLGRRPRANGMLFGLARKFILQPRNERYIGRLRRVVRRGTRDLEALDAPFLSHLLGSWREGLQASTAGMAADARIYGEPWPFRLDELQVPTRIWHGEEDEVVPASIGKHYHAHIAGSSLRLFPEEGHVSLVKTHLDSILTDLRPFLTAA